MKKNTIILILALVVLVVGSYFVYRQSKVNDGASSVATSTATSTNQVATNSPAVVTNRAPEVNPVTWKTFRNDQYGFEFTYPSTWSPESYSNGNDGPALYYRLMPNNERYGSFTLAIDNRKSLSKFLSGIRTESGVGGFPTFTVKEFKVNGLNSATITSVPGNTTYFISNQVLELSSGALLNFRLVINDSKKTAEDDLVINQTKSVVASVKELK